MASTRTHEVVATVGEYTSAGGERKKRYLNVGSAFTDDQGRVSLKLDAVPVAAEWSGWLSLYPVKDRVAKPAPQGGTPGGTPGSAPAGRGAEADEDIPF